jgi:hypothetical protein
MQPQAGTCYSSKAVRPESGARIETTLQISAGGRLDVDSAAFRKRALRTQLSEDPDTATQQTVQEMCRQVQDAARDPLVRSLAIHAVKTIRGGPLWLGSGVQPFESPRVMAESCWWWCKHRMRFKHHSGMFEVWSRDLGDPRTKLQLLISPDVLVRMRRMEGDCAIYTMMIAAMLDSLGLRWEICTAAVDRTQPDIFSHVWPRVVYPDGGREPLDASHGRYPGWQVPAYDIHRLKVWSQGGQEIPDQARRFDGLHAYRATLVRGFRGCRRGLGAIGDCLQYDDSGVCLQVDNGTGTPTPITTTLPNPIPGQGCTCVGGTCLETGNSCASPTPQQITVPAQNTAAYANLANTLIKQGFTLAEINSMPAGTVINPNGQIIRQAPGYAVTTGALSPAQNTSILGTGTGSISPTVLLIGLAIAAMAFMGGKGR